MEAYEFLILPISQLPRFDIRQRSVSAINGVKIDTKSVDIRQSTLSHVVKWETKSEKSVSAQFWLFCSAA
jgi:hypothetical protein